MRRGAFLLVAGLVWLGLAGAGEASAASSGSDLTYYGGPVAHSMQVILVEWGSTVRTSYTNSSSGDPAFFSYLASQDGSTSDIGGVLAQYMDTSDVNSQNKVSYGGMVQITPPTSGGAKSCLLPSCVDDSTIQSTLQSNIQAGTLAPPSGSGLSTVYVVLFPPNTDVCDSGSCAYSRNGFCAYHGSFQMSSTQVLYDAMVDNGPGTPNFGFCGPSSSDLANQTSVVSHEFSETINDPLVAESGNTFGPPLAWYNPSLGEIGDICVGPGEEASNGPWTVQRIWSNLDQNCVAGEPAYGAPTASFLAPSTAAPGQAASFDAASSSDPTADTAAASYSGNSFSISSGITSYQWNWGDGTPVANGSSPTSSHTFAAVGNYQVSLTVTDDLGFTSTVTREVSVSNGSSGFQAPAPRPTATTGAASRITSTGATVAGTVNPDGVATTYLVEFGTSSAYGHSTISVPAGSGTSAVPVRVVLSGLHPRTTYHYRLVAMSAGGTAVGAGRTFTTGRPLAPAPRFKFGVFSRPRLAALARGLKLRFSCSKACTAHFTVALARSSGISQFGSVLLTIAGGHRRLRSAGTGTLTITFSRKVRVRLRGSTPIRLRITGYAVSRGSNASSPKTLKLTLS